MKNREIIIMNIYNKIGELGVYIYTLSLFISKSGISIGLGFLILAFLALCQMVLVKNK